MSVILYSIYNGALVKQKRFNKNVQGGEQKGQQNKKHRKQPGKHL